MGLVFWLTQRRPSKARPKKSERQTEKPYILTLRGDKKDQPGGTVQDTACVLHHGGHGVILPQPGYSVLTVW